MAHPMADSHPTVADLSAAMLLNVWEAGQAQPPIQRALLMLSLVHADMGVDELAGLAIGRRDAGLLWLRSQIFGDSLASAADCPSCGALLEFELDAQEILATAAAAPDDPAHEWRGQGYTVQFRLPTSRDVMAALAQPSTGQEALLAGCILDVSAEDQPANGLPAEVQTEVAAKMLSLDPLADVQLDLICPACDGAWQAPFDIGAYLWEELERWARRTLQDVHMLATYYGWPEAEILALSAWRRQRYLELIYG